MHYLTGRIVPISKGTITGYAVFKKEISACKVYTFPISQHRTIRRNSCHSVFTLILHTIQETGGPTLNIPSWRLSSHAIVRVLCRDSRPLIRLFDKCSKQDLEYLHAACPTLLFLWASIDPWQRLIQLESHGTVAIHPSSPCTFLKGKALDLGTYTQFTSGWDNKYDRYEMQ